MSYLEELLPEFRKGAKIRCVGWNKEKYIHIPNPKLGNVIDETGKVTTIPFWYTIEDFWELYQEPIDWQYIIDHKCLCWFWNYDFKYAMATYLREKEVGDFLDDRGNYWANCCPVRRDEVTFYEDIML